MELLKSDFGFLTTEEQEKIFYNFLSPEERKEYDQKKVKWSGKMEKGEYVNRITFSTSNRQFITIRSGLYILDYSN